MEITALEGLPLFHPGDDLAAELSAALRRQNLVPQDEDVIVLAQKIISKTENRYLRLDEITPSAEALALAETVQKDPRLVAAVLSETRRVVRAVPHVLIVEHKLGHVMANAGIDQSNVDHDGGERLLLLPVDPDGSAAALKARLDAAFGVSMGVVINDSFGRPWRNGVTGVALGVAGLPALHDMVGATDLFGREMRVTQVAQADEIAAAASLMMGQGAEGRPAVLLRGLSLDGPATGTEALIRPAAQDLFR
ncbi:coenzyme F420-0:L-glutamate ligase [Salipiger sp. P9]|uniref:coenzyme F420-0:L-glutamate ligase n=1 Tax=Salipiger pentaromativorans TaxID=2943193 RepID=UPI002157A310|nr:coenzyme F420-0:L-glutamate ligase [Salipiger pentaromativorans]MCR8547511.1 coenzyme F420-0:L-glutamate ligase [Salipiger pentaromativorans]